MRGDLFSPPSQPVLLSTTARRERRKRKGERSMQKKKKKEQIFTVRETQKDHVQECQNFYMLQSTVAAVFQFYQGCDFYRTQPAAVYAFGLISSSTASSHNQKLFSFNSFVKVPCCLLFLDFPLLCLKNQDCLLAYFCKDEFVCLFF